MTLKSYDRNGLVFYCSSFSKMLAPWLSLGWTMPGKDKNAVKQLKLNHTVASPTLIQYAAAEFLRGGAYDRHHRNRRTALKNQVSHMAQAIATYFPPDTRPTASRGGLLLWVALNPKVDSLVFFPEAQRRRIAILPGIICSTTPKFNHFIRISCGFPWTARIEEGVQGFGEIAHQVGDG